MFNFKSSFSKHQKVDEAVERSRESDESDVEVIDSDVEDEEDMTYFMEKNVDVWERNGGVFNICPSKEQENRPPKEQENCSPKKQENCPLQAKQSKLKVRKKFKCNDYGLSEWAIQMLNINGVLIFLLICRNVSIFTTRKYFSALSFFFDFYSSDTVVLFD